MILKYSIFDALTDDNVPAFQDIIVVDMVSELIETIERFPKKIEDSKVYKLVFEQAASGTGEIPNVDSMEKLNQVFSTEGSTFKEYVLELDPASYNKLIQELSSFSIHKLLNTV